MESNALITLLSRAVHSYKWPCLFTHTRISECTGNFAHKSCSSTVRCCAAVRRESLFSLHGTGRCAVGKQRPPALSGGRGEGYVIRPGLSRRRSLCRPPPAHLPAHRLQIWRLQKFVISPGSSGTTGEYSVKLNHTSVFFQLSQNDNVHECQQKSELRNFSGHAKRTAWCCQEVLNPIKDCAAHSKPRKSVSSSLLMPAALRYCSAATHPSQGEIASQKVQARS